mmetsp:Transcript_139711/g.363236  ORF Transcript_139711/g.363236 Transcript_139711/m.363236 type:complete len:420 (+) Transcript_139711:258-1517(+)
MVHGLLGAVQLEDAIAAEQQELVLLGDVNRADVRHNAHLLLFGGQVLASLVVEVAQGPREVQPPPVDPHARPHGADEAASLLDALRLGGVVRLVVLRERHGLARPAQDRPGVPYVGNDDPQGSGHLRWPVALQQCNNCGAASEREGIPHIARDRAPTGRHWQEPLLAVPGRADCSIQRRQCCLERTTCKTSLHTTCSWQIVPSLGGHVGSHGDDLGGEVLGGSPGNRGAPVAVEDSKHGVGGKWSVQAEDGAASVFHRWAPAPHLRGRPVKHNGLARVGGLVPVRSAAAGAAAGGRCGALALAFAAGAALLRRPFQDLAGQRSEQILRLALDLALALALAASASNRCAVDQVRLLDGPLHAEVTTLAGRGPLEVDAAPVAAALRAVVLVQRGAVVVIAGCGTPHVVVAAAVLEAHLLGA